MFNVSSLLALSLICGVSNITMLFDLIVGYSLILIEETRMGPAVMADRHILFSEVI